MKVSRAFLLTPTLALSACLAPPKSGILLPPTGPHAVGTLRDEIALTVDDPFTGGPRRLVLHWWYPARDTVAGPPYAEDAVAESLSRDLDLPEGWQAGHYCPAGDPAPGTWPVVVFSPGFGLYPHVFTGLTAGLASHGIAVVAIQHSGGCPVTVFADGSEVHWQESWWHWNDAEAFKSALQEHLVTWVRDARGVLTHVGALPEQHPLVGLLDTERIAYVGHSYGGTAALHTATVDDRLDAAVNVDGNLFGWTGGARALLLPSEERGDYPEVNDSSALVLRIAGSGPLTASDIPFLLRAYDIPVPAAEGRLDPERGQELYRQCLLSFLGPILGLADPPARPGPPAVVAPGGAFLRGHE